MVLEIIVLIVLSQSLAGIAHAKGRTKAWAALGAICLIVGELLGGVVGLMFVGEELGLYMMALLGAAIGAGIAWMIVNNLSATHDSMEGVGDDHAYTHADADNPYSPPGFGKRD